MRVNEYFAVASLMESRYDDISALLDAANAANEKLLMLARDIVGVDIGNVGSGYGFGRRDMEYEISVDNQEAIDQLDSLFKDIFDEFHVYENEICPECGEYNIIECDLC